MLKNRRVKMFGRRGMMIENIRREYKPMRLIVRSRWRFYKNGLCVVICLPEDNLPHDLRHHGNLKYPLPSLMAELIPIG